MAFNSEPKSLNCLFSSSFLFPSSEVLWLEPLTLHIPDKCSPTELFLPPGQLSNEGLQGAQWSRPKLTFEKILAPTCLGPAFHSLLMGSSPFTRGHAFSPQQDAPQKLTGKTPLLHLHISPKVSERNHSSGALPEP